MIWGVTLGLLALSALLSGTETGLFRLDPIQRAACALSPSRLDQRVDRLLANPRSLLQAVLFGNLCVNVAFFAVLSATTDGSGGTTEAATMGAGLLAVLVFGELLPKILAWSRPMTLARAGAWPLSVLVGLVGRAWRPIDRLAAAAARALMGTDVQEAWASREEIAQHLARSRSAHPSGTVRVLEGVLHLEARSVTSVMVPRVDLAIVPAGADRSTCMDAVQGCAENRGVFLGGEDLARCTASENLWGCEEPETSAIESVFVPEQAGCLSALRRLRAENRAFGVVVDEHGGAVGVVWMEDLLAALSDGGPQ